MTRARDFANLASTSSVSSLSNRNLIINGAMQVAQRATSTASVTSTGYHACDRWDFTENGRDEAVFTISQNSSDSADGFSNSFKVQTTTAESAIASSEYFIVRHKIEAQNLQRLAYATSSAKSTTLSFYVKSSVAATFAVYIYKSDSTARIIGGTYTINSANTWEYKTLTFAGDTDSGATINNDNGDGFHVGFVLAAGSDFTSTNSTSWADYANARLAFGHAGNAVVTTTNATWEITGAQLEVGETATPFEHRSFADEWDRCQRYCTVYNVGGGNTHGQNLVSPNHTVPGAAGHVDVGNRAEWFMSYPVKRSQPTITVTDPTNMRWLANGNVVVDANGSVTFPVGTGHQNANVFQGVPSSISTSSVPEGWLYKGSGTNPVITIDAEL